MRFLLVVGCPDATGAHLMAHRIALALVGAGHRVGFMTTLDELEGEQDFERASTLLGKLESSGVQVILRRVTAFRVLAAARSLGPDVVMVGFQQSDRKHLALASLAGGGRVAVHVGNPHRFWGTAAIRRLKETIFGFLMRNAIGCFIATSVSVKTDLERLGVKPAKVRIVPNGIPLPPAQEPGVGEGHLRRELGLSDRTRLLMSVGRIDPQKGQDILLAALSRLEDLPDWHYVVVGPVSAGNQTTEQRNFIRRVEEISQSEGLRDRVTFLGFREDVLSLLYEADLFVHPSRWEGPNLCLAAMEAMAAARYCIVSKTGDKPGGFVQRMHGVLVAPEEPEQLAQEIRTALAMDPAERALVGRRGRQLIEARYSNERLMPRVVEILVKAGGEGDPC